MPKKYVNTEELKNIIKSRHYINYTETEIEDAQNDMIDFIMWDIDDVSSADVRENITCENIGTFAQCDQFICSNCGIHLQDWSSVGDNGALFEYNFNYCPNCGAKVKYGK